MSSQSTESNDNKIVSTAIQRIVVPNVFGERPQVVEQFLRLLPVIATDACTPTLLDLSAVTWVRPFGAVVLIEACRHLWRTTGRMVQLTGIAEDVHRYLRRVDFFERLGAAACSIDPLHPGLDWGRSSSSPNVLELSVVASDEDINAIAGHARRILSHWLDRSGHDVGKVVRLLSEACTNVVDHSRDVGTLTIQKYEYGSQVEVCLGIGDGGQGIRASLKAVHGEVSDDDAGYIFQALGGLSSRASGKGGFGLGEMRRLAVDSGGSLYVRSGSASVAVDAAGATSQEGLVFLPGTQVEIVFRSHY